MTNRLPYCTSTQARRKPGAHHLDLGCLHAVLAAIRSTQARI